MRLPCSWSPACRGAPQARPPAPPASPGAGAERAPGERQAGRCSPGSAACPAREPRRGRRGCGRDAAAPQEGSAEPPADVSPRSGPACREGWMSPRPCDPGHGQADAHAMVSPNLKPTWLPPFRVLYLQPCVSLWPPCGDAVSGKALPQQPWAPGSGGSPPRDGGSGAEANSAECNFPRTCLCRGAHMGGAVAGGGGRG
ncbi:unnamed protein product [Nyctereutes procyonoides]|uniref:(raccoon dog) hypothetical protein n=1 Tax=Nyctereutes procyonoides TaxID=34880 RepID=A0A811XUL2_NYCPR|nr:unnamed protein product [Nyctereutes procyonoides]